MLTKKQLRAIAADRGINPYYLEKEYLQTIFLYSLFKEKRDFVFKGGTCLKLAYNYARYSEDLDFNSNLLPENIQREVSAALKSFPLLGIEYEIIKEDLFGDSCTAKIRFKGPFFSGKLESTNTIQIDVGYRGGTNITPRWVQINSPYSDIPMFFILAMKEEEILAEKIRALVMRAEPRDMFDVWSMFNRGVSADKKLVKEKLAQKGYKFGRRVKFCNKAEYENILANLLPALPPYEQVVTDLNDFLRIKL